MAALNDSSGFVRQAALEQVQAADVSADLLQCLLERLNDWVPQVRKAAAQALERVWPHVPPHLWLRAWPGMVALRRRGRSTHAAWLNRIEQRLVDPSDPQAQNQLLTWTQHSTDRHAAWFGWDVLWRHSSVDKARLITWALQSRFPLLVRQAWARLRQLPLTDSDVWSWATLAMQTRDATVRASALRTCMPAANRVAQVPLTSAQRHMAQAALSDANGTVRGVALWALGGAQPWMAEQLAQQVRDPAHATPACWVNALGLAADLGPHAPMDVVQQALLHPLPKVRRAAYRAAFRLGQPAAEALVFRALDDPAPSVQRSAVQWARRLKLMLAFDAAWLQQQPWTPQRLQVVLRLLEQHAAWSLLVTLLQVPQWMVLTPSLQEVLVQQVQRWLGAARACYVSPTPTERTSVLTHWPSALKHWPQPLVKEVMFCLQGTGIQVPATQV